MKAGNDFKHLVERNVTRRHDLESRILAERIDEHKRILLDYADGKSIADIRKNYGYSHMQLYRLLADYGLPRRYSVKTVEEKVHEKRAKQQREREEKRFSDTIKDLRKRGLIKKQIIDDSVIRYLPKEHAEK